jgi:hypothetical protein
MSNQLLAEFESSTLPTNFLNLNQRVNVDGLLIFVLSDFKKSIWQIFGSPTGAQKMRGELV